MPQRTSMYTVDSLYCTTRHTHELRQPVRRWTYHSNSLANMSSGRSFRSYTSTWGPGLRATMQHLSRCTPLDSQATRQLRPAYSEVGRLCVCPVYANKRVFRPSCVSVATLVRTETQLRTTYTTLIDTRVCNCLNRW